MIFALAAVFVFYFGFGSVRSGSSDRVAEVNGQPILITDYARVLNKMTRQYQEMGGGELTAEMIKAMHLREMARNRLIAQALLLQGAERQGLTVSDAELRRQIQGYPVFQRNGRFDENLYFLLLARNHLSITEFEAQERQDLQISKIISAITSLAKVSDAQIQETFNMLKEAVRVNYLEITPDRFLPKQLATEAETSRYYQDHLKEFRVPARARVNYLVFRDREFEEQIKIPNTEVEDFIKAHAAEFLRPKVVRVRQIMLATPAKAAAASRQRLEKQEQELLGKLKAGEDFARLAKTYSQDPVSRDQGGYLGEVRRGQHSAQWDQVAFSLKPGEVGLAETPQGIYLIEMEGVKETETIPGAEALVTQRLKRERARPLAQEAAEEARAVLSQEAASEVVKKYGDRLKETPWFSLNDQIPGLGPAAAFNEAALKLKPGEVSPVVELAEGFAVMKSLEYEAGHLPPLSELKEQVAQDVKKEGARKEAEQEAIRLLARLKQGETLAQVAAAAHLPVKETAFFTRFQGFEHQPQAADLTGASFLLSREHPYPDRPIAWKDGYYLLAFKERRPADQADLQKNWGKLKAQLLDDKKQMLVSSWLEAEHRRAKIKLYALPGRG